jgi:hypothetical protein
MGEEVGSSETAVYQDDSKLYIHHHETLSRVSLLVATNLR